MKKFVASLLVLSLITCSFAGCGQKPAETSAETSAAETAAKTETKAETAETARAAETTAAPEERMTIKWIVRTPDEVAVQNTAIEKLIEERFNVDIEVAEVNSWQTDSLSVYLASNPEFDVMTPNVYFSDYTNYYNQGILRTYSPEDLEKYMPTYMAACRSGMTETDLASAEQQKETLVSQFGGLINLPSVRVAGNAYYIMAVRQDWLDKLGLPVPKTYDELVNTLIAFAKNDPDGNGVNDTYGIDAHPTYKLNYLHLCDGVLHDAFKLEDDGNVYFIPATEAWKENLKKCAAVYAEGAIDPEWVTDTRAIVREKWAAGKFGIMVDAISWFDPNQDGNMQELLQTNYPDAKLTYLDPIPMADGTTYVWAPHESMYTNANVGAFSATCSDEKMHKIMEIWETMMTDQDLWLQCQYGEKGIDWEYTEEGVIQRLTTDDNREEIGIGYFSTGLPETFGYRAELVLSPSRLEIDKHYSQYEKFANNCNNGFYFVGSNESYNTYYADVDTLADEYYYNAIAGKIDIDATWDAYVESLNNAGLGDIVAEYQAYVDKYVK